MIESLATIISHFFGEANRARCLAHIVNLVAKIILRQFDSMPKGKKKKTDNVPNDLPKEKDDNDSELDTSDEETEDEEAVARVLDKEEKEMDECDDEDADGEDADMLARDVEIMEEAMEEEIERVLKKAKPVGRVLFKVSVCLHFHSTLLYSGPFRSLWEHYRWDYQWDYQSFCFPLSTVLLSKSYPSNHFLLFQLRKLAYAIKNSTTIILPRWNEIIEQSALTPGSKKKLSVRKMPRDVSTRWNSTYDMVKFACTYRDPINKITDDRSMKLRDYELKDHEWKIVEELRDCLKVCDFFLPLFFLYPLFLQIFKTVTLEFSTDTPCIANVIPMMD